MKLNLRDMDVKGTTTLHQKPFHGLGEETLFVCLKAENGLIGSFKDGILKVSCKCQRAFYT